MVSLERQFACIYHFHIPLYEIPLENFDYIFMAHLKVCMFPIASLSNAKSLSKSITSTVPNAHGLALLIHVEASASGA